MVAIIDLDPLVHIISNVQWSQGNHDNEEDVRIHVNSFINSILKNSGCDSYLMFVQGMEFNNFRKAILEDYKAHRFSNDAIQRWKPVVIDEAIKRGAFELKTIESDDALGLISQHYGNLSTPCLLVENDKDLHQLPGAHYNPYKPDDKIDERFYTISNEYADKFFWIQMLTGDSTDNIMGCGEKKEFTYGPKAKLAGQKYMKREGVGPKAAELLLNTQPYSSHVFNEFVSRFGIKKGLEKMLETYHMIKMLQEPQDNLPETFQILSLLPTPMETSVEDTFSPSEPTTRKLFPNAD